MLCSGQCICIATRYFLVFTCEVSVLTNVETGSLGYALFLKFFGLNPELVNLGEL